jgi:hypothetical protein
MMTVDSGDSTLRDNGHRSVVVRKSPLSFEFRFLTAKQYHTKRPSLAGRGSERDRFQRHPVCAHIRAY